MRVVFGDCTFDRDRRELTRHGTVVHAGPKVLGLLELLIDARPRALTKDEIHKTLWTDTFVSDGTLTSLVAELRDAIGDEARAPRFVRTIHGYGYNFCGDVAVEGRADADPQHAAVCRIFVGDREVGLPPGVHNLGRSADAAIFVDDVGVSRHHARITVDDAGAILQDLGSKNGTMLNGRAIEGPTALADGAAIVLGTRTLKFRVFAPAGSTDTVTRRTEVPRDGE
jgi:DNA-binding winged helix-turn-helix (wHTH) protein